MRYINTVAVVALTLAMQTQMRNSGNERTEQIENRVMSVLFVAAREGKLTKKMEIQVGSDTSKPSVLIRAWKESAEPWLKFKTYEQASLRPVANDQSNLFFSYSQIVPKLLSRAGPNAAVLVEITPGGKEVQAFMGNSQTGLFVPAGILFTPDGKRHPSH